MNRIPSSPWYKANTNHLHTALSAVDQAVEDYSDRQKQQHTDIPSALAEMETTISPPSLEHLCTTFNLSFFEREILLLCVAQAVLPYFAQVCAQVQEDEHLTYPTFNLAMSLFSDAEWNAALPTAPLQYWQLLQVATGQELTRCRLQIDNSILLYLLGLPYQDDRLIHLMQPLADGNTPLQPSHQHLAEQLAATWSQAITLPVVQLCGMEVAEKWAIATSGCTLVGRSLKVMSARSLPTDITDFHDLMRRWEREVTLTNSALLLDCEQLDSAEPALKAATLQWIQNTSTPLIISTEERLLSPRRPLTTFEVSKLTTNEQKNLWHQTLININIDINSYLDTLVFQFNLSTLAIQSACLAVKQDFSKDRGNETAIPNRLWDICRTIARPRLDDLAQRIHSTATWDDFVLPEPQCQILHDIATHVRQRAKVYLQWGFASQGSRGLGIAALFAGTSGTGKTMAAEILAKELHLDLYRIDLSAVVSKYIGETEKNLRQIFDAAEAGGVILLFDEADALFGKRSEVKDSRDRHANVEVGYLLQRMEAYQGLAILTTNLKSSLDQAFLRRLRFVITFPFPDSKSRAEIWRRIFPKQTPTQDLDFEKLAQLNLAGGNIRNIALNAAFGAAEAESPVMMRHILSAAQSECIKLERTLTDTEIKGWV
ncbi:MAG: ATP-binding protein [Rhizonema sp. PD37]|nr:ATP-binding protein [Rhizonema sp. PD37]